MKNENTESTYHILRNGTEGRNSKNIFTEDGGNCPSNKKQNLISSIQKESSLGTDFLRWQV